MRSLSILVVCSTAIAILAFTVPFPFRASAYLSWALCASYFLSMLWGAILLYGLKTTGRRGLWILFGLPLCLLWPLVGLLIWASCEFGGDCI
jgi:hypothetical protein